MSTVRLRFPSDTIAEHALAQAGFSLGTGHRNDPRGVLHGRYWIDAWRNLANSDLAALHGTFQRDPHAGGGATVVIYSKRVPPVALDQLEQLAAEARGDQAGRQGVCTVCGQPATLHVRQSARERMDCEADMCRSCARAAWQHRVPGAFTIAPLRHRTAPDGAPAEREGAACLNL